MTTIYTQEWIMIRIHLLQTLSMPLRFGVAHLVLVQDMNISNLIRLHSITNTNHILTMSSLIRVVPGHGIQYRLFRLLD